MTLKPFRLLKTPWLVLEKVILLMEPPQIIELVQCSARTHAIVKCKTIRQHYNLHFEALPELTVTLHAQNTYDAFPFEFSKDMLHRLLGYSVVWHPMRRPHLSDQLYVMKNLVSRIISLYTITFELVELDLDYWENSHPELIYRWLNSFGDQIQQANIYGEYVNCIRFQQFLENFQFSKRAHLSAICRDYPLETMFPMFPEDLHIGSANWVTRKYLLTLTNCVTISLEEVNSLSDAEINLFLHNLITGANPKLEYIKMNLKRGYNGERVLQGIVMYHEDSGRVFRRNDIVQLDEGGHYFQLDNGEIATIFFYPNEENPDAEPESIGVVIWKNKDCYFI